MEFYYSWDSRYSCYSDPLLNRSHTDRHNLAWNKSSPEYEYSLADSFCNEDSWIESNNSYNDYCPGQVSTSPPNNPGTSDGDRKESFDNLYTNNNDLIDLNFAMKCQRPGQKSNTVLPDLIQNIEIRSEQPSSSSCKEIHSDQAMSQVIQEVTFNSTTYCQLESKKSSNVCTNCHSNFASENAEQCKTCADETFKKRQNKEDGDLNFTDQKISNDETKTPDCKSYEKLRNKDFNFQSKPCSSSKFRENSTKNRFQLPRQTSSFQDKKQFGQCAFEVSVTFKQGVVDDEVKANEIVKQNNDRFFQTFRLKKNDSDNLKTTDRNKPGGQTQEKKNSNKVIKPREVCSICGKQFASAAARQRHSLLHVEVRPYRCDSCGIGFKLKVHLKKHNLYKHTDEYPCECRVCGKRFKDSSAVRLHERIHSNERPFQCQCGKSFKTRENLWGHRHRRPCIKYLVQEQTDTCGQANKSLKLHPRKCELPTSKMTSHPKTSEAMDRPIISPDQFKPPILASNGKSHPLENQCKSSFAPSLGLRKFFPKTHEHQHTDVFTTPERNLQSFPASAYPPLSSTSHYLSRNDIDYESPSSLPPFESLVGQKPNLKCFGKYLHEECISFDSRQWPSECLSNFDQMNKQHWINSCHKSEYNWKVSGCHFDGDHWPTHNSLGGPFDCKADNHNYKCDRDSENVFKYGNNAIKSSCAWGSGDYFNHSTYRYDRFPDLDGTFKQQFTARFQPEFTLRSCSSNVYSFY